MIPPRAHAQSILTFLDPIRPFLDDGEVSEVLVNGPDEIYVERRGRLERTDARFPSGHALSAALRNIAQYVGRPLDEARPILEGHLPDGSRIEALLPPVAPEGPAVAIRRFSKARLGLAELMERGALCRDAAELLGALVVGKQNILVAGGTGSGKTSMLGALSELIPAGERIVVIEDARELRLLSSHVVHLEARPADARGRGAIGIRDLFVATLRMRPDRIVVGELRGGEALDLVQAMTSGHGGCLSTVHASHPRDAIRRLETLALMGKVELPLSALRRQIASAIDVVVQTTRRADGSRGVCAISEVRGIDEEPGYRVVDLMLERRREGEGAGWELRPTGELPGAPAVRGRLSEGLRERMRGAHHLEVG